MENVQTLLVHTDANVGKVMKSQTMEIVLILMNVGFIEDCVKMVIVRIRKAHLSVIVRKDMQSVMIVRTAGILMSVPPCAMSAEMGSVSTWKAHMSVFVMWASNSHLEETSVKMSMSVQQCQVFV